MRRSPWPRRLAATLAVVVVAPLVHAAPASAAPRSAPAVQKETPVRGQRVPVLPQPADPAQKQAWRTPPSTGWPKPQAVELDATGDAQARSLTTGFPVRLAAPKAAAKASTPERVRVELLDTAQTGLLGLAMRVTPGQGVAAKSGKTRLEIDYSGFRHAFGGDYGARLRMVRLEECALSAAASGTACPRPEPVPGDNDTKTGTLTADVDLPALYAVTAAAA
ncbi:hypothetical protein AB0J28_41000, partial [Streptosporangium canum]